MRMLPRLALVAVATGLVVSAGSRGAAAPVPKHLMKEPDSDKDKLQGKWKVESIWLGGKSVLEGQNVDMMLEFKGDTLTVTGSMVGEARTTTMDVKHDASGARRLTATNTRTIDGKGVVTKETDNFFGYGFRGDKLLLGARILSNDDKKAVDPLKPSENDVVVITLIRVK